MADSLRDSGNIDRSINSCEVCGSVVNLKLCARCKEVAYCSKEHQKQAWARHKKFCKKVEVPVAKIGDSAGCSGTANSMGVIRNKLSTLSIDRSEVSSAVTSHQQRVMHQCGDEEKDNFYSLFTTASDFDGLASSCNNNDFLSEKDNIDKSFKTSAVSSSSGIQSTSSLYGELRDVGPEDSTIAESGSSEKFILETEESEIHAPDYLQQQTSEFPSQSADKKMPYFSVIEARNKALGDYVTKCLNSYGLCVIDNFLGDSKGTDIFDEVVDMYEHGELTSGQLVNSNSAKGEVRGDVITWIDGTEIGCSNVSFLVSSIDAIMLHCQRSLGHYHIKGRSKAMVAAYPGNSTGFLRHVDNPSGDGRCVTCIYYLNKGWNSKVDGGLLRIFPEGTDRVANVEPKFDRLLFFWSDRRNPHEVLPAYRMRYAVTVWYYDEQERKRAVKKFKGSGDMKTKQKEVFPLSSAMSSTS